MNKLGILIVLLSFNVAAKDGAIFVKFPEREKLALECYATLGRFNEAILAEDVKNVSNVVINPVTGSYRFCALITRKLANE